MAAPRKRRTAAHLGAAKVKARELAPSSFWPSFAAAHASMQANARLERLEPKRLVHRAPKAAALRGVLDALEAKSGVSSAPFAPYAGDFFYTRMYWLGSIDESGLHPFGGELRLQGVGTLMEPFALAPGWGLFDDHPVAGDGVATVIRAHEGRWQLGVEENGHVVPMEIDVPTYMQALLDLRGAFGWQWLFVPRVARERREKLLLLLARVEDYFGTDVARYRARLARPSR